MYGDVTVRLAGESYVLRYPNAAWDSLKHAFGVPTEVGCIDRAKSTAGMLVVLQAGLACYHSDLDVERILELQALKSERTLSATAWEAVVLAMPAPKTEPEKLPSKPEPKPVTDPHHLRREAFKAGMTPTEFSVITPREAVLFIEAAGWRVNQQHQLAIAAGWYGEVFARTKTLDDLDDVVNRFAPEPRGPMTPEEAMVLLEEQKADARSWAARHNARVAKEEAERGN